MGSDSENEFERIVQQLGTNHPANHPSWHPHVDSPVLRRRGVLAGDHSDSGEDDDNHGNNNTPQPPAPGQVGAGPARLVAAALVAGLRHARRGLTLHPPPAHVAALVANTLVSPPPRSVAPPPAPAPTLAPAPAPTLAHLAVLAAALAVGLVDCGDARAWVRAVACVVVGVAGLCLAWGGGGAAWAARRGAQKGEELASAVGAVVGACRSCVNTANEIQLLERGYRLGRQGAISWVDNADPTPEALVLHRVLAQSCLEAIEACLHTCSALHHVVAKGEQTEQRAAEAEVDATECRHALQSLPPEATRGESPNVKIAHLKVLRHALGCATRACVGRVANALCCGGVVQVWATLKEMERLAAVLRALAAAMRVALARELAPSAWTPQLQPHTVPTPSTEEDWSREDLDRLQPAELRQWVRQTCVGIKEVRAAFSLCRHAFVNNNNEPGMELAESCARLRLSARALAHRVDEGKRLVCGLVGPGAPASDDDEDSVVGDDGGSRGGGESKPEASGESEWVSSKANAEADPDLEAERDEARPSAKEVIDGEDVFQMEVTEALRQQQRREEERSARLAAKAQQEMAQQGQMRLDMLRELGEVIGGARRGEWNEEPNAKAEPHKQQQQQPPQQPPQRQQRPAAFPFVGGADLLSQLKARSEQMGLDPDAGEILEA